LNPILPPSELPFDEYVVDVAGVEEVSPIGMEPVVSNGVDETTTKSVDVSTPTVLVVLKIDVAGYWVDASNVATSDAIEEFTHSFRIAFR
jgi:hypothetical protein